VSRRSPARLRRWIAHVTGEQVLELGRIVLELENELR
jgi:hypothetical protein